MQIHAAQVLREQRGDLGPAQVVDADVHCTSPIQLRVRRARRDSSLSPSNVIGAFRTMLRDCPAKLAEWKAVTRGYDRQCEEYFKYLDDHESE